MQIASHGAPAAPGRTLAAAALSFFMAISATTAVNVALPPIGREFGATVSGLTWVVNAYSLVFASLLLSCGALGDRIGVRRVFRYGLGLFIAAEATCGLAPTLTTLVAAQTLAGLGAAAVVPTSLTLISRAFIEPAARARAIAVWAATGGAALAAGPLLGGVLIAVFGWRSVFGLNVVAGLAAVLIAGSSPATSPGRRDHTLDPAGQVLAITALGSLTFALVEGRAAGWTSGPILAAILVAVLATAGFLLVESRSPAPMLPLHLFRVPAFSAATWIGLLLNFGCYGQVFVLALYFQNVRGYSPLYAGLAFLPMTATVSMSNLAVGRLLPRTGNRRPLVAGAVLCGSGLLALGLLDASAPYAATVAPMLAVGFGGGLVVPPMTAALLAATPPARLGVASGVLNSSRQAGGVIGVALFGSLIAGGGFVAGMRVALLAAASALLLAAVTAMRYIDRPGDRPPASAEIPQ
ncbi:MAG: MFS transporter [Streptosporangiales bacterium]|nr:MFS transporter [Streptosporangiales bacterium]